MNNFPKNLCQLRKQNNITQQQLASKIKKANTTIGNWENGLSQPNIEELLLLSQIFRISIQELIEGDSLAIISSNRLQQTKKDGTLIEETENNPSNTVLEELKKINLKIEELKLIVDQRLPDKN